jgi:hypothetical protein
MPISPSDLPWWGWLACAIGGAILMVVGVMAEDSSDEPFGSIIAIVGFLAMLTCGAIGIIRFVKWVWSG